MDNDAILTAIPCNDRKVVGGGGPFQSVRLFLELLEFHCQLTLAHFVIGESLEMRSETEPRHDSDEPFSRVVLVPLDGIAIVHGELVVEVVVTLADGNKSGEDVITRSMLVIERSLSEPVSK